MYDVTKPISSDYGRNMFFEGNEEYSLHQKGDWVDQGKFQYAENIFKDKDGLFWSLGATRLHIHDTNYEYVIDSVLLQLN